MRSYGLSCDNLIGAEVVTADGEVVTASEDKNADLLWGLRGGGGNFGVVTKFTFQLHPVETVLGGMIFHPIERAPDVLRHYRDFTATAPDSVTVFCGQLYTPDGMPVAGYIVCATGPLDEAEANLRPLREFGPPIVDMVQPMPDGGVRAGPRRLVPAVAVRPRYPGSRTMDPGPDGCCAIDQLVELFDAVPVADERVAAGTARTTPLNRIAPEATGVRLTATPAGTASRWRSRARTLDADARTHRNGGVRRRPPRRVSPTAGVHVNGVSADGDSEEIDGAWTACNLTRLAKLKARYRTARTCSAAEKNANIAPRSADRTTPRVADRSANCRSLDRTNAVRDRPAAARAWLCPDIAGQPGAAVDETPARRSSRGSSRPTREGHRRGCGLEVGWGRAIDLPPLPSRWVVGRDGERGPRS